MGAVALSQWLFPSHFEGLWTMGLPYVLVMAARNGLLVALFVLLWRHRDSVPAPAALAVAS